MLLRNPGTESASRNWVSYYDRRTLYSGSGEPLRAANPPRNLLRTGWGPRGDSGPERDRVRASQPANLRFPSLPSPLQRFAFYGYDQVQGQQGSSQVPQPSGNLGSLRSPSVNWRVACTRRRGGCEETDGNPLK